jgi:hypothetical protein
MSDNKTLQTVWITKYWETRGIIETQAKVVIAKEKGLYDAAHVPCDECDCVDVFYGNSFFLTKEEAITHVKNKKINKVKALKKKIEKLVNYFPEAIQVGYK